MRRLSAAVGASFVLFLSVSAAAAPTPPRTAAHPRLFLDAAARTALVAKLGTTTSGAARAVARCKDVAAKPASYTKSGYQGDTWAFSLSACALAFQLTGDAAHATAGIKLWNAILSDVDTMGDGKACVVGATRDQAIAAVKRDTGYAIRFIGPHTALAYDWLHDAPGVDEPLRAHTRACFKEWVDWYTATGYLNDEPGANYHAGYVAAKSLIAVAEAGEAGADGDRHWNEAVDDILGKQLVGKGLAAGGPLVGGDWNEGWQYGPLSVLHYALAARALGDHGAPQAPMQGWADSLTLRFVHGLYPSRDTTWVGGDFEGDTPGTAPNPRVLLATLVDGSSPESLGHAAFLHQNLFKGSDDAPAFEAIAEARAPAPIDPWAKPGSTLYVAQGTRTIYARSGWDAAALYAVFASAPRQVADHQHVNATNFVLSRGKDALVVDPTPYGSRSTLTSNALTLDSTMVKGEYAPSQTPWSKADLPWARGTASGVVAARGDFAKAFIFADKPSDIAFARRDWVLLPEGEVVTIDRARTDADARGMYLRFRTPGKLALAGGVATATVGGSKLAVHAVKLSGGTPAVKSVPGGGDCWSGPFGSCATARFAVDEYAVKVPGPRPLAVHVLDALGASDAPATVTSMDAVSPANTTVVGAGIARAGKQTYVVASSGADGVAGATLTYTVPKAAARHVVFDAPEDGAGKSLVTAAPTADGCVVTIVAGAGFVGHPLMFSVDAGCAVSEDPDAPPAVTPDGGVGPSDGGVGGGDGGVEATPGDAAEGGCGCRVVPVRGSAAGVVVAAALMAAGARRRRARRDR